MRSVTVLPSGTSATIALPALASARMFTGPPSPATVACIPGTISPAMSNSAALPEIVPVGATVAVIAGVGVMLAGSARTFPATQPSWPPTETGHQRVPCASRTVSSSSIRRSTVVPSASRARTVASAAGS